MNVITDKKAEKIYRVVDIDDKNEPFGLLDENDVQIRMDANPRRLVDFALEGGLADRVRHDYSLIKEAAIVRKGKK